MKKFIIEFLGTFFLVSGAILAGGVGAGLALMIMVYAGGHISGAHYNPAVSIAMYIRGKMTAAELPGYFIAQFLGAAAAAVIIYYLFQVEGISNCDGLDNGVLKTGLAEFLGTFALAFVILNVATAKGTAGNSYFGLAIGGTVLAMATLFGRFSGGVFNPAVGIGLAIQKTLCWSNLWVYFIAQVAAGFLAAYTFKAVNEKEEQLESIPEEQTIKIEGNLPR